VQPSIGTVFRFWWADPAGILGAQLRLAEGATMGTARATSTVSFYQTQW